MTPGHSYKGYLAGIFTGALVNGRKWTGSWAGQILSSLAWVQTALHAGYACGDTMRHMHRAVHRAYADSPHNVLGTVKAVHGLSYLLPARKCAVVEALQAWLVKNASWEGDRYTSWAPRGHVVLRAYDTVWNHDWEALHNLKAQCCPGAGCVCVCPPGNGWYVTGVPDYSQMVASQGGNPGAPCHFTAGHWGPLAHRGGVCVCVPPVTGGMRPVVLISRIPLLYS